MNSVNIVVYKCFPPTFKLNFIENSHFYFKVVAMCELGSSHESFPE